MRKNKQDKKQEERKGSLWAGKEGKGGREGGREIWREGGEGREGRETVALHNFLHVLPV